MAEYTVDVDNTLRPTVWKDGVIVPASTGQQASSYRPECPAPVASFTASAVSGNFPLTVNFTDTSTNNPSSWLWDFGDGNTSTLQNPSHTFTTPAEFTVTLTVDNECGTATHSIVITTISPYLPAGAWWEFEENDGTFQFLDSTGNGNHLTTSPATSALSVAGGIANRAHYRGGDGVPFADRKIYIPRSNTRFDFGLSDSFTVGGFFKAKSAMVNFWGRIIIGRSGSIDVSDSLANSAYGFNVYNQDVYFYILENNTTLRVTDPTTLLVDTWYFLVGVVDIPNLVIKAYNNNAFLFGARSILTGVNTTTAQNFTIGTPMANDAVVGVERQFNGYVDKAFLTPKVLSPADISWLYNGGVGRTCAEALTYGIFSP